MNIRVPLRGFFRGGDVVVIVKCPDTAGTVAGKYVVGRHRLYSNVVAFVFDATASFHPVIAKQYQLIPLGGGRFLLDHNSASIWIGGSSETYGTDPDRELTVRALSAALPGYTSGIAVGPVPQG